MAQFKDLFTELRRDTGLSQEDFAALFHQSGSTISSYETGRNQPSFDMLIQYADYFNVTTDYLLGRVPFDMSPSVFTDSFIDNVTIQDVIMSVWHWYEPSGKHAKPWKTGNIQQIKRSKFEKSEDIGPRFFLASR